MAESPGIFLQIIPLKIFGEKGRYATTYGLIDFSSDVTMIDVSLIYHLDIQGEKGQLLSTLSQREKQEKRV